MLMRFLYYRARMLSIAYLHANTKKITRVNMDMRPIGEVMAEIARKRHAKRSPEERKAEMTRIAKLPRGPRKKKQPAAV